MGRRAGFWLFCLSCNIALSFHTARHDNAGVRPERLYGFYPEIGDRFSAYFWENKSNKRVWGRAPIMQLRGGADIFLDSFKLLIQDYVCTPSHAVRISSKRSAKNIIDYPIIVRNLQLDYSIFYRGISLPPR